MDGIGVTMGQTRVLSDVTFDSVPDGVLGLIGPNGSGKTTTLRCISGALRPQRGRVLLDGRDAHAVAARERARIVATVPQGEETPPGTVLDAVLLGRSARLTSWQRYGRPEHDLAERAMRETGVADLHARGMTELSGGERQRVLIARALVQDAPHLLLDEPTNHLDVRYQHEILSLVRRLGLTTVVVLHDLTLAARYCDRLVLLDAGQVVAQGPPQDVLVPELLERVYRVRARLLDDGGVPLVAFSPAP
ncbi:MAG: ABC transporter ATP-binding protein [Arachnia sp.]